MVKGKIISIIDNGVPASKEVIEDIAQRRIKEEAERIDLADKEKKMKICLRCGKESKDNVDYCPDCGRPIYKEKPVEAPIPEPNKE